MKCCRKSHTHGNCCKQVNEVPFTKNISHKNLDLSKEKAKQNLNKRISYNPMEAAQKKPVIYGHRSKYAQENLNKSVEQKESAWKIKKMEE